jgi:hypothetical protein
VHEPFVSANSRLNFNETVMASGEALRSTPSVSYGSFNAASARNEISARHGAGLIEEA